MTTMRTLVSITFASMLLLTVACGNDDDNSSLPAKPEKEIVDSVKKDSVKTDSVPSSSTTAAGHLTIKFDYTHYPTLATGQYAIWIENMNGKLVRTIFVTRFTARGGYKTREDAIPTWVAKAKPADMSSEDIDGVTGATPQNGNQTYTWDGRDDKGNQLAAGKYRVCIEGTMYWASRVLYQGNFAHGGASNKVNLSVQYSSEDNTNRDMLRNVSVEYTNE